MREGRTRTTNPYKLKNPLQKINSLFFTPREREKLITHVVLFKLIDPTPGNLEKTKEVLMNMKGKIPQLREIAVGADLLRSPRSYDLALITKFVSMEDLKSYQEHPLHQNVLTFMATVRESSVSVDFQSE